MRFFIDHDHGAEIHGWIVPDNPLAVSRVVVAVDGRRVAEVPANQTDDAFRQSGWHSTGQCTFNLTEAEVPGLAGFPRLELYDADTNVLVHRRAPADGLVQQRVVLINTGIEPETAIQAALFPHFRAAYFGLQNLSDEILTSVFAGHKAGSTLLSGAVTVPRYEQHFTPDLMLSAILVQDPHVEMAARMLWLRARAALAADPERSWRLGRGLSEAALFAGASDLSDGRGLKRFFRMLPEPAYHLLYNPLTRQLGTRLPDDRLQPGNSIVAIEILARLGVVGHRTYYDAFCRTLFDRLGVDAPIPAPPPIPPEVQALAARLREVRDVRDMLVFDVAMSDAVLISVAKSWAS